MVHNFSEKEALDYLQNIRFPYGIDFILFIEAVTIKNPVFLTHSAATTGKHHDYAGGLLIHTAEVVELCESFSGSVLSESQTDVLLVAAILHDHAKIYDYVSRVDDKGKTIWERTKHGKEIYHVVDGYQRWITWASGQSAIPTSFVNDVGHAMLAHHGRKEWGSPVEPQTPVADILHFADTMSVKYSPNLHRE